MSTNNHLFNIDAIVVDGVGYDKLHMVRLLSH